MSEALRYAVRIIYRFPGSENDRSEIVRVTATDSREAQSQARLVWLDTTPQGQGVQFLGCVAMVDDGQLALF